MLGSSLLVVRTARRVVVGLPPVARTARPLVVEPPPVAWAIVLGLLLVSRPAWLVVEGASAAAWISSQLVVGSSLVPGVGQVEIR